MEIMFLTFKRGVHVCTFRFFIFIQQYLYGTSFVPYIFFIRGAL